MGAKRVKTKQPEFAVSSERLLKKIVMQDEISHFYAFETREDLQEIMVVPDGSVDIVFCCDAQPYAYIAGTPLHCGALHVRKHTRYFGVRFLPGVVPRLGDYGVKDLIGGQISMNEIPHERALVTKICETQDFFVQTELFFEEWTRLQERRRETENEAKLTHFLVNTIVETHGMVTVKELAESCHYSVRHLHQVMQTQIGISPKTFSKILRFQSLLSALTEQVDNKAIDLAEIAAATGYYDQSHMMREFKDYTGVTPMKYLCHLRHDEYSKKLIVFK